MGLAAGVSPPSCKVLPGSTSPFVLGPSTTHIPWKEPLPPPLLFILAGWPSSPSTCVPHPLEALLEPCTLTENVLGLPVVFRFEFLAPVCWCYPT